MGIHHITGYLVFSPAPGPLQVPCMGNSQGVSQRRPGRGRIMNNAGDERIFDSVIGKVEMQEGALRMPARSIQ